MGSKYTAGLTIPKLQEDVLRATRPPMKIYYLVLLFLACGIGAALTSWLIQIKTGMGVAGITHPVGWALYITNFVFWVGIAHSGTLISAILFLVRAKFRDAISRSSEAMTVFAVLTAGMFPLIHLGRFWVFYFILPYPNQRQVWPNFQSPLVWDLVAVFTYLTVSVIFFYVGLIPDLASARDRNEVIYGKQHWRYKLYKVISLGWRGALTEWRHYGRSYLFFAALATPLVISVHSIVSWDFAVGILPGWHTTIFAPYFVAGAIHSGLAMVLTLMIPMRKILQLEDVIKPKHMDMVARVMIVTTLIIGYSYIIEPLFELYDAGTFEVQFTEWRMTGWIAWVYYVILPLNFLVPLSFIFKKVRKNLKWLFIVSILVNVGMWLERFFIVVGSTAHDFLPHNWGVYRLSWVEFLITAGSFAFFFFFFLIFAKILPTVPIAEFKEQLIEDDIPESGKKADTDESERKRSSGNEMTFVFYSPKKFVKAVETLAKNGIKKIETFTPVKMPVVEKILGLPKSPVRIWTLIGAVTGLAFGFYLPIASANVFDLIVDGKHATELIPYFILGFEFMVLFGSIANLVGMIVHSKLYKRKKHKDIEREFTSDKYGIRVTGDEKTLIKTKDILNDGVVKVVE